MKNAGEAQKETVGNAEELQREIVVTDDFKISLSAGWKLSFTHPVTREHYCIKATVPGNVELDLQREDIINDFWPPDDYDAMRIWETVDDWTYETAFDSPVIPEKHTACLVFKGIDTIADITLNGEKILHCENMLISHSVDVSGKLKAQGNKLTVHIYSSILHARKYPYDAFSSYADFKQSQAYLRKAAHMWGWDNAPRLLSAGLWRPVYICVVPPIRFTEVYAYTKKVIAGKAYMGVNWAFETPDADLSGYSGRISLEYDGKIEYSSAFTVDFTYGVVNLALDSPLLRLWWPRGYGDPALYNLKMEIVKNGESIAQWAGRIGIREIVLDCTELINEKNEGEFVFRCNGHKIYINGTNWKPLDAVHSRSAGKIRQALDLCLDLNCNMVRIWGGGVYEDNEFFDYCDENGLLVWQDFMFACGFPPRNDFFLDAVGHEAMSVVKSLRNHPSLALWCGDNEVDSTFTWGNMVATGILPSDNKVSRKVLREAVLMYDPYRPYIGSSPYFSDIYIKEMRKGTLGRSGIDIPEKHLYPHDENFRTAFRNSRSRFVGETGPLYINSMSESPEYFQRESARARRLWDQPFERKNYTLARHQIDAYFLTWKDACRYRMQHYFGRDFRLEPRGDLALGVNIICGDIFKFAIEYSRSMKWRKTGVLWWSLIDMWPMLFNYSVVDYSFCKKMPYYWIRQSQQPFCLMAVRQEEKGPTGLYAANDTLKRMNGCYTIYNVINKGEMKNVASGSFDIAPNENMMLQSLELPEKQMLLIIEWKIDQGIYSNHYISGDPPFDFDTWKYWSGYLKKIYKAD